MRTPYGKYPQYHTSADDIAFLNLPCLVDSFRKCLSVVSVIEHDSVYVNLNPKCEPQLGKRGLYRAVGGQAEGAVDELVLLWVLNLSDGHHSLLDIAEKAGRPFAAVKVAADALLQHGLLHKSE
jgi:aminopeptidase-like protein